MWDFPRFCLNLTVKRDLWNFAILMLTLQLLTNSVIDLYMFILISVTLQKSFSRWQESWKNPKTMEIIIFCLPESMNHWMWLGSTSNCSSQTGSLQCTYRPNSNIHSFASPACYQRQTTANAIQHFKCRQRHLYKHLYYYNWFWTCEIVTLFFHYLLTEQSISAHNPYAPSRERVFS